MGVSGALRLSTSDGSVLATGVGATDVEARSSDGDVVLSLGTTTDRVVALSSDGRVQVALPRGSTPYRVDAGSSDGTTQVQVPTDPAAPRTITAHSSAGDVTVTQTGQ